MAFSQYPLRCRFWAELTQNLSLSASWRRISWKNALRGGHFEAKKIENIPSHRKIKFLVTTKYSGNPQPRSLRLIMLVFRAKVTQPHLTFGEIVKISPLISKKIKCKILNLNFIDKRSPWWSIWSSEKKNLPSHRKNKFFDHYKVFKERITAMVMPNYLWGSS